jgi:hypothetical protein
MTCALPTLNVMQASDRTSSRSGTGGSPRRPLPVSRVGGTSAEIVAVIEDIATAKIVKEVLLRENVSLKERVAQNAEEIQRLRSLLTAKAPPHACEAAEGREPQDSPTAGADHAAAQTAGAGQPETISGSELEAANLSVDAASAVEAPLSESV